MENTLDIESKIVRVSSDDMSTKYNPDEIIKLENEVRQVGSLFQDISLLVSVQQEGLDRIEDFIHSTEENVISGNDELKKANKYSKVKNGLLFGSLCIANVPLSFIIGPQISIPLTMGIYGGIRLIKNH